MSQAFISYHHAQRKLARLIAHRVAADGHSVWWDRSDRPGDSWSEAVSSALARSACVIVIWSKQAAHSPAVLGEATAGFGRGALISITSDKTPPPSPFDTAPTVDMQDWEGDSIDVAWIRLREPIRAKMQVAEVKHVEGQPLPPQRPPPPRTAYYSAPLSLPPAMPEEKRGPSAASALMVLAIGGLAATGWYFRDELRQEASRWQAALQPQSQIAAIPETPAVAPSFERTAVVDAAAPTSAATAETSTAEGQTTAPLTEAVTTPIVAGGPSAAPVPADKPGWDDGWVPPPVLRQIPRAPAEPDPPFADGAPAAPAANTQVSVVVTAPAPAPAAALRINLRQGRFVDIDSNDPAHKTDIWFAPDRSGDGLYLGVTNGARMRIVPVERATRAECARSSAVMRRTPIGARELARGTGVCVRTSANEIRVVHVEGIEGSGREKVLRLRIAPR
ncbi:MAG: toll/interleukin-1 receptor domain-containing protein [Hyphomonadaceae bacterium]|nr:MAG: hypothetical protein FD160_528 [Caulobacteraceae bacterium]MBT9446879.1 toll/interleukin-1 receptor domain-containing protein [Hyphomonadaceae bacterium]TPW05755.1 MAG: hypothetical protein FD124_2033 [Alphaproteobacteria bacterium]